MIKKIPPMKSQKGIEIQYQKQLNKLGKVLILEVRKQVLNFIKAQQSSYVMDGFGDQLGVIFRRLNAVFTGTAVASFAETAASKVVQKIGAASKSKFGRAVARATGVDLVNIITSEGLEDFMALSVNKNVSLIKSLPEEYLKQVETIVNNGVVSGARYSTIEKEITSKTGANSKLANRIKTIARNEVQTINSQITLRRSENLGITKGIYKSSKDERVRKSHAELDGVEYELKKGAWSKTAQKFIQPGITDINCRCSYSPIIQVGEEKLMPSEEKIKISKEKIAEKPSVITPQIKTQSIIGNEKDKKLVKIFHEINDNPKHWDIKWGISENNLFAFDGPKKNKVSGWLKFDRLATDKNTLTASFDIRKNAKNKSAIMKKLFKEFDEATKEMKGIKNFQAEFATEEGMKAGAIIAKRLKLKLKTVNVGYQKD